MWVTRRGFLKFCTTSAAALGLEASMLTKLTKVLAADTSRPTVVWLEGSACSGCTVSLANLIGPNSEGGPVNIADLLINHINLAFAKTLMTAAGDLAMSALNDAVAGDFILVVEGGIPTAFDGMACTIGTDNDEEITMQQAVQNLASQAGAVICVGSCSSFGGIPAAYPNPTNVVSVSELTGLSTINIPGCPAHPDWVAGSIAALLCGVVPEVDEYGRPVIFFGKSVCSQCPRKPLYDLNSFADDFGQEGRCLLERGCRGPSTNADCPSRGWNNGFNYCTQANANCIGCVENDFPANQLRYRP